MSSWFSRVFGAILAPLAGCGNQAPPSPSVVQEDTFIEFRSEIGNVMLAPSEWQKEDRGTSMSLIPPDGRAIINIMTFTVDGSGEMSDFQQTIIAGTAQDDTEASVAPIWEPVQLGDFDAFVCAPNLSDETDHRVYTLRAGAYYHAIVLEAEPFVMQANGPFYENMIKTFAPIQ